MCQKICIIPKLIFQAFATDVLCKYDVNDLHEKANPVQRVGFFV
jgi:hypothetical protein